MVIAPVSKTGASKEAWRFESSLLRIKILSAGSACKFLFQGKGWREPSFLDASRLAEALAKRVGQLFESSLLRFRFTVALAKTSL